jgi:ADP-heptose:LPS heptosyltransferase
MIFQTAEPGIEPGGVVTYVPLRIYTGLLGQIGDIIMFTATARRLKELFPNCRLTFAVSRQYREAGELVVGLPYVDRLFVTELYFEKLTPPLFQPWERGWPVDFRGEDEVREQRGHDLVLETRPRHRRERWWEHDHQVAETAHMVGVPGPIDLRTEIRIPDGTRIPPEARGKIVLHNDPAIDPSKAWSWEHVHRFVEQVGAEEVVLLGGPGPAVPGVLDLRGRTTLAQAAATIEQARCYVGIDSGLMWIAGSLQVPAVGLYGTSYIPAYEAVQPRNPRAVYLQAEGTLESITPERALAAVQDALGGLRS